MTAVTGAQVLGPTLLIWSFYFKTCLSEENMTTWTEIDENYDSSSTTEVDYDKFQEDCPKASNRSFRSWFLPSIYATICLLALVGNFLVILTYLYFNRLKTMTDVYLLNLAVADLLFAVSLPFWAASIMTTWEMGLVLCKTMHSLYKVTFFSGMLLLTCISMDRYFAITKAVSAHRCRSHAVYYSKVSSVVIWVLALLFSMPEMVYAHIQVNSTCVPYDNKYGPLRGGILVGQMVLGFAVPALVMGFCYSGIVRTLLQARSFEKNKAIKVIFAVVAVFLLCQLPYNVVVVLKTLDTVVEGSKDCDYDNGLLYAMDVMQAVAFLRCCLNPFLYAFIGVKFRHDLLKLLKDLGCMSQQRFFLYTSCGKRRSSVATETETTTTFSP